MSKRLQSKALAIISPDKRTPPLEMFHQSIPTIIQVVGTREIIMPPVRIELTTSGLWDLRSTNWAKETSKSWLITWLPCPSSMSYLMMMGQIAIDTNKFVEKRHRCACLHRSHWLPVYAQWFLPVCAWLPRSWHQVLSIALIEIEDSQSCDNWASVYCCFCFQWQTGHWCWLLLIVPVGQDIIMAVDGIKANELE